jgi:hypothetical protein
MTITLDTVGENMTQLGYLPEPNAPLEPLPEWLAPSRPPSKTQKELLVLQYESLFMRVLELIPQGRTLKSIIDEDIRAFEYGSFLRWINKDPSRKAMYSDAKELRTETWAGEIIEIADASDSLEDVNRSKLRIDSRKWLMGADFRKQYGASTQVEFGGTISILTAMNDAKTRMIELADDSITDLTPRLSND